MRNKNKTLLLWTLILCVSTLLVASCNEDKPSTSQSTQTTEDTTINNGTVDKVSTDHLKGIALMNDLNCSSCHSPTSDKSHIQRKQAPLLKNVSSRLHPTYIQRFIASPQQTKPGTSMPHLLHNLSAKDAQDHAQKITHYLMSLNESTFKSSPIKEDAIANGQKLFHSIGCVACHAPRDSQGNEIATQNIKPMGSLKNKYSVTSLVAFLEDPLTVRPSGRMPNMNLQYKEAHDLAHYLLQGSTALKEVTLNKDWAKEGEMFYKKYQCAQCHDTEKSANTFTTLEKLNIRKGCLDQPVATAPQYTLSADDKKLIKLALDAHNSTLSGEQQISKSLLQFNCVACHQRGDLGGVSQEKMPHFTTKDMNLGMQGKIPPDLNKVGWRLKESWLKKVLEGGAGVRPYMNTRMPRFGKHNVGHLITLFKKVDAQKARSDYPVLDDRKLKAEFRRDGENLLGLKLKCFTCHTYKNKSGGPIKALDLYGVVNRLEKDYFVDFMLNPGKHKENIIMPSFWPGGQATFKDIRGGNTLHQLEAIWQYLSNAPYNYPRGLISKPVYIHGKKDEAVMLRRSFQGIKRRAISVGYPQQINLAFDADNLNVVAMWKGDFLNVTPAFKGQGEGDVKPLGKDRVSFVKGPLIHLLADDKAAWPKIELKKLGYQFKGYRLDKKRRPTFRYHYKEMKIEDKFTEKLDRHNKVYLERVISIESNKDYPQLQIRTAVGEKIEKIKEGGYRINNKLIVNVTGGDAGRTRSDLQEKQTEVIHKTPVKKGRTIMIVRYQW